MKRRLVRLLVEVVRFIDVFYEVHRYDRVRTPQHFSIGRYSYAPPRVIRYEWDTARLSIGSFCSIAWDATFMLGGNHHLDRVTTFPLRVKLGLANAFADGAAASRGDIMVGNDVWIGSDALILSGVTIGSGAVVGARAVVTKDVRPYAVVAGNPAREIRRRFRDEQVAALMEIAWWNWPIEQIEANVEGLSSGTIDDFIRRFGRTAA